MDKPYLKPGLLQFERTVDRESGEILSEETTQLSYVANTREDFFLVYVRIISAFYNLNGRDIKTFAFILENFDTAGMFGIPKAIKEELCSRTGIKSAASVDQSLLILVRVGLLIKIGRGTYQVNPIYVFKGSTSRRKAVIQLLLENGYEL